MTGTVQRELLLLGGWDLGLVVLKGERGFSCSGTFWGKHCRVSARTGVLPGLPLLPGRHCVPVALKAWGWKEPTWKESCSSKNLPSSKFRR